ncbi:hypothetical protein [Rummeliibacillus sp. POC4]|nr:hypothetical protein [Rummeliibacillus sp. POC4]
MRGLIAVFRGLITELRGLIAVFRGLNSESYGFNLYFGISTVVFLD